MFLNSKQKNEKKTATFLSLKLEPASHYDARELCHEKSRSHSKIKQASSTQHPKNSIRQNDETLFSR